MFNYLNCFKYPMKKILTGFLGLFLVIGIVAGAGYAVFTDQVRMTGMVLGTATPGLEITFYNKTTDGPVVELWAPTLDFTGQSFQKLLPGEKDWGGFWLRNVSTDGATNTDDVWDPLDFTLKGSILSAYGSWDLLKDVIQMRICVLNTTNDSCDTSQATTWMTMNSWFIAERNLPGGVLESGDDRGYMIEFYIPDSYGNEIAGKTITGMTMQVTGTQVVYAN